MTLLYGCMTWTLRDDQIVLLRTAHRQLLMRIIGCHKKNRTGHPISYLEALQMASSESLETPAWKCGLIHGGRVIRVDNKHLPVAFMLGELPNGSTERCPTENKKEMNW